MPFAFTLSLDGDLPPKKKAPKQHIRANPITTQGKILKARQDRAKGQMKQALEPPPSSEVATHESSCTVPAHPVPQPKGRRPQLLPPPEELAEFRKQQSAQGAAAARGIHITKGKWDFNRNKPMTTRQKIAAMKTSRTRSTRGAIALMNGGAGQAPTSKTDRSEVPGVYRQLEKEKSTSEHPLCDPTSKSKKKLTCFTDRFISVKVEQSRLILWRREANKDAIVDGSKSVKEMRMDFERRIEPVEPFRYLGLPKAVQQRVIRFVVVDNEYVIWPETKEGRQQPDFSMVCKEVRADVLPIYYAENTFGVSVAPVKVQPRLKTPKTTASRPTVSVVLPEAGLTGLNAVREWAQALSHQRNSRGEWLDKIRTWVFSYEDPESGVTTARAARAGETHDEDKSFIISVGFPEGAERLDGRTPSPNVAVHRVAACVLTGSDEYGQCVPQKVPLKLISMVHSVVKKGGHVAGSVADLAEEIRGAVDELSEVSCERAFLTVAKRQAK